MQAPPLRKLRVDPTVRITAPQNSGGGLLFYAKADWGAFLNLLKMAGYALGVWAQVVGIDLYKVALPKV